jgi:regulator of sirC expression with transglutaminase-like and TPR domain
MDAGLRELSDLVQTPEPALDLARGALLIARVEHGGLDSSRELARLDGLARRSGAGALGEPRARLERLRAFLFEEERFRGDAENYYDPRNSCLNDVLDRKLGIPITLSVLMMEVGRRLGLAIAGVGLPGHFVVRAEVGGEAILLDPFNAGAPLSVSAATEVAARAVGRPVRLGAEHFTAVTKVQILTRMLLNLEAIYVRAEAWEKALAAVDRLLIVEPGAPRHGRDRGAVLVKLGRFGAAAEEWERYLGRYPNAQDAAELRQQLRGVRQRLASLN